MITHIVMFKLRDRTEENMKKAAEVLAGLKDTVPVVRSLEVGVDVLGKPNSYDVVLTATFDSLDDLNAYQVHPEHKKVVEYIKETCSERRAVDYES